MTIRGFKLNKTGSEIVRTPSSLVPWLNRIVDLYNSHSCNQFILTGNTHDLFPSNAEDLATLPQLVAQSIVPRYNVVLTYDIGNGIRVERGADLFSRWQARPEMVSKHSRTAIELITVFLRYAAN